MIGGTKDYADFAAQDWEDSQSLYRLLEDDIVPLFYERSEDDVPSGWLSTVKKSIQSIAPAFSTARMVKEYTQQMYLPAMTRE